MTKITDLLIMSESELREHIVEVLRHCEVPFIITPEYIVTDLPGVLPLICTHTDTVMNGNPRHIYDMNITGDIISLWSFSAASILGADDRAGVYISLEMIKRGTSTPFNYGFFCKEEVGAVGSSEFCKDIDLDQYSCIIGLDRASRKGVQNIATYSYDNDELIEIFVELGYQEQYGSFSDCSNISSYCDLACVNLSVGYYSEHTKMETLGVSLMEQTLQVMLNVVIPNKVFVAKPTVTKYGKSWPAWMYEDEEFESYHGNYRRRSSDNILDAEVSEIYPDDGLAIKICCDFCSEFAPLYEIHGSMVCESCLPLVR